MGNNISQMAKISPLRKKFDELPKNITLKDVILPNLKKYDITQSTFYRDLESNPNSIPNERLQVYAGLLDCDVSDLMEGYTKIKVRPIVKKSLTKKVGLK